MKGVDVADQEPESLEADRITGRVDVVGSNGETVKTIEADEYEAMVAELAELRPLRYDLRMIDGIVGRHR